MLIGTHHSVSSLLQVTMCNENTITISVENE